MGDKTKEQLLEELIEVQKMLEKRTEAQGQMIRKFQTLIASEGLFSQIIDLFPYPLAIFTPQYTLAMVNKSFETETKMRFVNSEEVSSRIFQHRFNDMQLSAAVTGVFKGGTFFLEDLKNPFSMFAGTARQSATQPDRFHKTLIFPVTADDAEITHGVIVFMP